MLETHIERFKKIAEKNFLQDGYLSPVFIAVFDDKIITMPLPFHNREEKNSFTNAVISGISAGRLSEFVMITESWMASLKDEKEYKKYDSLEHCPGRKEIIIIQHSSTKGDFFENCDILRSTTGDSLSEWKKWEHKKTTVTNSGLFQGLFLKASAYNN
jgi:hypothetical protein